MYDASVTRDTTAVPGPRSLSRARGGSPSSAGVPTSVRPCASVTKNSTTRLWRQGTAAPGKTSATCMAMSNGAPASTRGGSLSRQKSCASAGRAARTVAAPAAARTACRRRATGARGGRLTGPATSTRRMGGASCHEYRSLRKDPVGGRLAALHAVGDADPSQAVAGEGEPRVPAETGLDVGDTGEVADFVLRHRAGVEPGRGEQRLGLDAEDGADLVADDGRRLLRVAPGYQLLAREG